MSFNLARLNHVFIPTTRRERNRLRHGWVGRLGRPIAHAYFSLSEEGRVVCVFALLAGFAGLDVRSTDNYLLWSGLTAAVLASYFLRYLYPLEGVRIEARRPDRVTVGAPFEVELTLHNDSPHDYVNIRIEGPLLPWDGQWTGPRPVIRTLAAGTSVTVRAGLRFSERGLHDLDAFRAAAVAPLGLCVGRGVEVTVAPFHVVPEVPRVERLVLPAARRYQQGGVALASKIGESAELLGLRPYRRGDRIRDLHSRSWARLGEPVVREYQQEYFSRVGVVLDTEMERPTEPRLEAAVSLTAGALGCLTRGEALIDVLVTDGDVHPLTVGRGLGHLEQALDHLSQVELRYTVRPGPEGRRVRWRARLEGRPTVERRNPEVMVDDLQPFLDRLSSAVVIVCQYGARQRAIVEGLQRRGLPCRVIELTREASVAADESPDLVRVAIDQVRTEGGLVL